MAELLSTPTVQLVWVATPQRAAPASADVLATVRGVLFRQPMALMLSDRDPRRSVRGVRENAVEISAADGQRVEIEFSPETGLPLEQSYVVDAAEGSRATRTETFADWREVDGVRFPFRAMQFENGSKVLVVQVSEYQINVGFTSTELNSR